RGRRRRRRGVVLAAAGSAPAGAPDAVRARGGSRPAPVRPHRRPAAHPGRDRPGVRGDPGADPTDRVQDHVEAAPPVTLSSSARLPRLNNGSWPSERIQLGVFPATTDTVTDLLSVPWHAMNTPRRSATARCDGTCDLSPVGMVGTLGSGPLL